MMLWVVLALMTAAAIVVVLWPLARKSGDGRGGSDLVVYQDQLAEIDRDRGAGLIGEVEAQAARVEVSRRLLAAADSQAPAPALKQPLWHRRMAAVTALVVLAAIPVGLYAMLGSPNIPDQPAFGRAALPPGHASIMKLVGQVEQHLASHPNDGAGWEVIAPVYLRMGRYDDAVTAWRKALTLNGETAARDASLGEALVAAADGMVTDEAKKSFERAIARDPRNPKARYYLGLADKQDGNRTAAAAAWRALLHDSPVNAPWAGFVREALAQLNGQAAAGAKANAGARAQGPTARQIAAAASLTKAQRTAMIQGMVAKLANQLHAHGGDVSGWLRLVRAYVVLGNRDKAEAAAADARRALAAHPEEVKRVDDLAKGLGLDG